MDLVRKAFEASRLALLVLTSDERVACASAGAAELLGGLFPDEKWLDRLAPKEREAWSELAREARSSGVVKNCRLDVLDRDGRSLPLLLGMRTVGDPAKPEAYLVSLEPYSETWQSAGETALETFSRLEQLSVVGQLAAGFAHEIKSPLHVILSTAELMLESQELSAEVKEGIGMISRNAQRAAETARALMDLSSSQHVELIPGSLQQLVERTLGLLELRLRARKIQLEKTLHAAPSIRMDAHQLQAVVYNLVTNATDSMSEGGKLTITVRPSGDGRQALLEVKDTGSGIAPEVLARIGEPFFTTKLDGTGMGMFLTKRVVREHHATLAFDSARGKGTTVTITFPKA